MKWKPYRYTTIVEAQARVETVKGTKIPDGFFLEITQMAIIDITTGGKNLAIGFINLTGTFEVFCENEGTNIHHHEGNGRKFVFAGEQPAGRITTATAGDDCHFSVNGKLHPVELEAVPDAEIQPEN